MGQARKKEDKLRYVLTLWEKRVEWWKTKFRVPKDFKYKSEDEKQAEEAGVFSVEGLGADFAAEPAEADRRVMARMRASAAGRASVAEEAAADGGRPGCGAFDRASSAAVLSLAR